MYDRQQMRRALESRDWSRVQHLAESCGENRSSVNEVLLEDTIHSGCLIEQRQREEGIALRDLFLQALRKWLEDSCDTECVGRLDQHLNDVRVIERCYREIRGTLRASAIAQRPAEEQAWAAIARLVGELDYLHQKLDAALANREEKRPVWFLDSNPFRITGDTGKPIDPDSAVGALARHLALTLRMLSHEHNWISQNRIVLPKRIEASEEAVFESGINSLLAHSWCKVEDASEHIRFFGGSVSKRRGLFQSPGEDNPHEADAACFELDFGLQQWELVARTRFTQLSLQNVQNLRGYTELKPRIRNVRDGLVAPVPEAFVSEHEIFALGIFEMVHHLSQKEMSRNYNGLTIFEWCRCYCVLRCYCNPDEVHPVRELRRLDLSDFRQMLGRCGIDDKKAQLFVDAIVFQVGKRDLYDAPVLLDADGEHWLLAPLFASANVAEIVFSQLGSRGASFDAKGSAFEEAILEAFRARQIPVKRFKYQYQGRQYQCDAAVSWGKHLFVLECKNDFLPTTRPRLSYYFWLDMINAARQVATVADHFRNDRSLVGRHFNTNEWNEIHPVVLSALPFSLPKEIAGAYFYDASALLRFLTEGSVGIAQQSPDNRVFVRAELTHLWSSDKPSAEDLLAQLKEPFQLKQFQGRIEVQWLRNGISPNFMIDTPVLGVQPVTPQQFFKTFAYPQNAFDKFQKSMSQLDQAARRMLASVEAEDPGEDY